MNGDEDDAHTPGISRIMDGIIDDVHKTRRVFSILVGLIILPLIATLLVSVIFFLLVNIGSQKDIWPFNLFMVIVIGFGVIMAIVIGFGIKHVRSQKKWIQQYKEFKNRLAEVDKKLDEGLAKE